MSNMMRIALGIVGVLLLVAALIFMFGGKSSCPEQGCRDYSGLSIAKIQPLNDGEALAVAAAQLASAEDRHAKAIETEKALAEAVADRGKAAFIFKFMEAQQKRADAMSKSREADDDFASAAGDLSGRRRGIPCGQDKFLPCR